MPQPPPSLTHSLNLPHSHLLLHHGFPILFWTPSLILIPSLEFHHYTSPVQLSHFNFILYLCCNSIFSSHLCHTLGYQHSNLLSYNRTSLSPSLQLTHPRFPHCSPSLLTLARGWPSECVLVCLAASMARLGGLAGVLVPHSSTRGLYPGYI